MVAMRWTALAPRICAVLLFTLPPPMPATACDGQSTELACGIRGADDDSLHNIDMFEFGQIDSEVQENAIQLLQGVQLLQPYRSRPVVLHFLFMATDTLPHIDLWKAFFESAPAGSWYGWVHCVNLTACQEDPRITNLGLRYVSTVPSEYCTDLISPGVQMLRSALTIHPGVQEKFVLMSDTTLPTKPFQYIYDHFASHSDSEICLLEQWKWPTASKTGRQYYLAGHHQWYTLTRAHAVALVEKWSPPNPSTGDWTVPLTVGGVQTSTSVSSTKLQPNPFWKEPVDRMKEKCMEEPLAKKWLDQGLCTDELAVVAMLFGAINGTENFGTANGTEHAMPDVKVPEWPNFRDDCSLHVSWWNDTIQHYFDPELMLAKHSGDTVWVDKALDPCDLSPITYEKIGPRGQRIFLEKPTLFVRKVEAGASLPGYADRMFRGQ